MPDPQNPMGGTPAPAGPDPLDQLTDDEQMQVHAALGQALGSGQLSPRQQQRATLAQGRIASKIYSKRFKQTPQAQSDAVGNNGVGMQAAGAFQHYVNDPLDKMGEVGGDILHATADYTPPGALGRSLQQTGKEFNSPTLTKVGDALTGITGAGERLAGQTIADPRNWPFFGAGTAVRQGAKRLMSGGFTAMMSKGVIDQSEQVGKNWDNLTDEQKWEQGAGLVLGTAAAGYGAHEMGSPKGEFKLPGGEAPTAGTPAPTGASPIPGSPRAAAVPPTPESLARQKSDITNFVTARMEKNHGKGWQGAQFTDEGLRQTLNLPADKSLKPLLDHGIMEKNEQGLYQFTDETVKGKSPITAKNPSAPEAKPTSDATVAAGGTGAASSEELNRGRHIAIDKSGNIVKNLDRSPDYSPSMPQAPAGKAVVELNPDNSIKRVASNATGMSDEALMAAHSDKVRATLSPNSTATRTQKMQTAAASDRPAGPLPQSKPEPSASEQTASIRQKTEALRQARQVQSQIAALDQELETHATAGKSNRAKPQARIDRINKVERPALVKQRDALLRQAGANPEAVVGPQQAKEKVITGTAGAPPQVGGMGQANAQVSTGMGRPMKEGPAEPSQEDYEAHLAAEESARQTRVAAAAAGQPVRYDANGAPKPVTPAPAAATPMPKPGRSQAPAPSAASVEMKEGSLVSLPSGVKGTITELSRGMAKVEGADKKIYKFPVEKLKAATPDVVHSATSAGPTPPPKEGHLNKLIVDTLATLRRPGGYMEPSIVGDMQRLTGMKLAGLAKEKQIKMLEEFQLGVAAQPGPEAPRQPVKVVAAMQRATEHMQDGGILDDDMHAWLSHMLKADTKKMSLPQITAHAEDWLRKNGEDVPQRQEAPGAPAPKTLDQMVADAQDIPTKVDLSKISKPGDAKAAVGKVAGSETIGQSAKRKAGPIPEAKKTKIAKTTEPVAADRSAEIAAAEKQLADIKAQQAAVAAAGTNKTVQPRAEKPPLTPEERKQIAREGLARLEAQTKGRPSPVPSQYTAADMAAAEEAVSDIRAEDAINSKEPVSVKNTLQGIESATNANTTNPARAHLEAVHEIMKAMGHGETFRAIMQDVADRADLDQAGKYRVAADGAAAAIEAIRSGHPELARKAGYDATRPTEAGGPGRPVTGSEPPGPGAQNAASNAVEDPRSVEQVLLDSAAARKAANPELTSTSPVARLTSDTIKSLNIKELGSKMLSRQQRFLGGVMDIGKSLLKKATARPVVTSFNIGIGNMDLSLADMNVALKKVNDAYSAMHSPEDYAAMHHFIEFDGDKAKLLAAAEQVPTKYRNEFLRAASLTDEQTTTARNLQSALESAGREAQQAGVLGKLLDDYVPHFWGDSGHGRLLRAEFSGALPLKANFDHANKRIFASTFEGILAGSEPKTTNLLEEYTHYRQTLNKVMATKNFVFNLTEGKEADGLPIAAPTGSGFVVRAADGDPKAYLVKSNTSPENLVTADGRKYVPYDHPALQDWKFITKGPDGKPIMLKGPLAIHPDRIDQLRAVLDKSWFAGSSPTQRVAGAILAGAKFGKEIMLTALISPFHTLTLGTHAMEHRVNPFSPPEIDLNDERQRNLVVHGFVGADPGAAASFSEGLGGTTWIKKVPLTGPVSHAFSQWLFQGYSGYMPRIKMTMALDALDRNIARHKGDLSMSEIYKLTADQANAAFGGLNFKQMGRSATMQDLSSLLFLAPDFFESRAKFVAQGATKYGGEQRTALILGAVGLYAMARVGNGILNDGDTKPDKPFSLVYKNKEYHLRTVQGDLYNAMTSSGPFVLHRAGPVTTRPAIEALTGRDDFGRTRDASEQLEDFGRSITPIGLQGLYKNTPQTLMDSFLSSAGIVGNTYRSSAEQEALTRFMETKGGKSKLEREQEQRKMELRMDYANRKISDAELQDMARAGKISWDEADNIPEEAVKTPFEYHFSRLDPQDALAVWDKANDKERATIREMFENKRDSLAQRYPLPVAQRLENEIAKRLQEEPITLR